MKTKTQYCIQYKASRGWERSAFGESTSLRKARQLLATARELRSNLEMVYRIKKVSTKSKLKYWIVLRWRNRKNHFDDYTRSTYNGPSPGGFTTKLRAERVLKRAQRFRVFQYKLVRQEKSPQN